ncbi:MAG TPA: transcriptional repressor [Terriglobales bacterium]|nr:transcriptional repressor [Terriglobales bacterium]
MRERCSKQRVAVQRAVCDSRQHPTAHEVYDVVRRELPNVSLATVYRNLVRLVADGKLRAVHTGDLPVRYEGGLAEHGHFVCTVCGCIFDLSEDAGGSARNRLEAAGFRIDRAVITLHGACPSCTKGC